MRFFYLLAVFALFFSGCAGKSAKIQEPNARAFRYFFDSDQKLKKISFKREISNDTEYVSNGLVRVERDILGKMYEVTEDRNSVIKVKNQQINPNLKSETTLLKNSREISFYEFGGGTIQSIEFSSTNAVCSSLKQGDKIALLSTTNYYGNYYDFSENADDLFAAVMSFEYENFEPKVLNYGFLSNIKDNETKQNVQGLVYDDKFKKILEANLQKQVQILNFLCTL